MPAVPAPFRCVELFAGDGNVSKSMKYGLVSTAQLDIRYQKKYHKLNAFDMATPLGLPSLNRIYHFDNLFLRVFVRKLCFCMILSLESIYFGSTHQALHLGPFEYGSEWVLSAARRRMHKLLRYQRGNQQEDTINALW